MLAAEVMVTMLCGLGMHAQGMLQMTPLRGKMGADQPHNMAFEELLCIFARCQH